MFKKKDTSKDTKNGTLKLSGKISKTQVNDLALLIAQMQKDADLVEKDVLRAEELLAVDYENDKKELPYQHQTEISDRLGEAEGLLEKLFIDVDKAKKLKHPQATEIESDVIHLHDRWLKDCTFYRDVYEQIDDVSRMPLIDWGPIFNEKQKQVNVEQFGPTMADLKKQIAAHNILHKEIDAYNTQLCIASAGSKEKYADLKKQYSNLLDNSKWRRHYLNSLHEYMQGCNKELTFLGEEQDKIKKQDWSDRMVDPPDVRRQYENFKNNSLLSHESEVNKLQDEGDRLIELKHPANDTIQAQRDEVRNEWQKFLNLCICQETHLSNVDDFKKYQYDSEQLSELLTKLNSSLDPKTVSKKSNTQALLQLEMEENDVRNGEQLLADLRRRSTTIAPLKLRRTTPSRAITVESLCDWETDKDSLERGEKFTLKSNSDIENWNVVATDGKTKTFPGVCFQVPPPDSEAIDKVDLLGRELADIKKKRAALADSLKNSKSQILPQQSAPVSSVPVDPKVSALSQQLDKLDNDLANAEKSMLSRLRAPLSRSDPTGDLAKRMKEQEQAVQELQALQKQQQAVQADMQPLLSKDPNGTSSGLPLKVSAANNKFDNVSALADLYKKKANASLNLENQIKKVDGLVSGFEKKLCEDGPIPDTPNAIQARAGDIQNQRKSVAAAQDDMKKLSKDLETTEFEKDPQLDIEATKLRDEIAMMRDKIRDKDGEHIQMKTEVTILQQKRPTIKERVVKKEVVKVEQNPEMMKAVRTFQTEISDESNKTKLLNDQIFQTRSQINALERLIPNIEPKIITKEVKKIEQDPDLINESKKIRTSIEEEKIENNSLSREVMELQSRYREVQDWKPKVEVKEIVNEIYRIDPNTEVEIMRIRKDIQECSKQRSDLDREITKVTADLKILRSEKPKVEMKEVLQEVIKEERSPENEKEIQRLNEQVNSLHINYSSFLDQLRMLRKDRDEWKAEKSKVETQLVTREVVKYEPDPLQEKELDRLRINLREETQLRRTIDEMVFDLKNKYILLERQKPEEKVVVQEVLRLQKDPRQVVEHERLGRTLDEEVMSRRQLELELQQLRTKLEDKERILRESDERQKRIQAESELREIRLRITQLENAPPPVEESIIVEEVLKVERDPTLDRLTNSLRSEMDKETNDALRLEREIRNIALKIEILQREKSSERTVYKEVVRVAKDQAVEAERSRLREQVSQSKFARQDLEDEIRRLNDKIHTLMTGKSATSREETTLTMSKDALLREKDKLTRELRTLEATRHDISLSFQQQSRLMSERTQMSRQRSVKMESDVIRLENDILDEKDKIHQRDSIIRELLQNLQREENAETRTKETNVSTKITILDPVTGKDMSPYDAYLQGLIDRQQYIHLQELECDWEEITSLGPDGEISLLQDRKSGKQYSIKDALKEGRLTEYDLQQYKKGKIPISEFALLVAGDNKKQSQLNSVIPKSTTSLQSAQRTLDLSAAREIYPVAGIIDTDTDTCYTIRNATVRKLIDPITAQRLLEAQAATGGIIDINSKGRYTVHKAANRALIEDSQVQRLLNAQKAFTGVEDPVTKECLSVGEAIQKGWMPKGTGIRYMEAQHLTGGLVNPVTGGRVSILDAVGSKMIDNTIMRDLQTESAYIKDIVDPVTKEKINYKQALNRCRTDPSSGFPMLPASSKESGYSPVYTTKYARF
ncbi:envoplakin a isoform X2 [Archocentrus centrarchus]|uniref:envoplakin a isoform X2 n=1 Tax=Archocentrus centrarchus TaxID=63155 RepID=UPI0011E9DC84|nr:envoplakin isoform X2 [Archocentrus centrarchus]